MEEQTGANRRESISMVAELISVGTELLLGNIVNTNAAYLSKECAKYGISVYQQVTVGDNKERLQHTLDAALTRSDLVILTGGLGPTQDDITKEAIAEYLNRTLILDLKSKEHMMEWFEQRGVTDISENNERQVRVMEGSTILPNDFGLAPGMIVITNDHKRIILLPGPDDEMIPMFERYVAPYLSEITEETIYSVTVKVCGISESTLETMIQDLIEVQENPTIATYAKLGEVHIRLTAKGTDEIKAKQYIQPTLIELKQRLKEHIYTVKEEERLEDVVVQLLQAKGLTVTMAESCTGGLLTSKIVCVPGVSTVFKEAFVTYSNKAKRKYLDVNKATLKKYGAVSERTAKEMVKGVAISTDCDAALAITGIAGPDGGTEEKPVGTVYIGCYLNEKTVVKKFQFHGTRTKIRELACIHALNLLRCCIIEQYGLYEE